MRGVGRKGFLGELVGVTGMVGTASNATLAPDPPGLEAGTALGFELVLERVLELALELALLEGRLPIKFRPLGTGDVARGVGVCDGETCGGRRSNVNCTARCTSL